MTYARRLHVPMALALLALGAAPIAQGGKGDVAYITTPQAAVEELLRMANVGPSDYVIDLGSGDGRVVITAAKQFGARGLGVELDPYLVDLSNANAKEQGVLAQAEFIVQNAFDTDLARATVVYSYLLPELNLRLRARLLELKPGTRILTHDYNMGEWAADQSKAMNVPEKVMGDRGRSYLFLWVVPARLAGRWQTVFSENNHRITGELSFEQKFQMVEGSFRTGDQEFPIPRFTLHGSEFSFDVAIPAGGEAIVHHFRGITQGGTLAGEVTVGDGQKADAQPWSALRTVRSELEPAGDDHPPPPPRPGTRPR